MPVEAIHSFSSSSLTHLYSGPFVLCFPDHRYRVLLLASWSHQEGQERPRAQALGDPGARHQRLHLSQPQRREEPPNRLRTLPRADCSLNYEQPILKC